MNAPSQQVLDMFGICGVSDDGIVHLCEHHQKSYYNKCQLILCGLCKKTNKKTSKRVYKCAWLQKQGLKQYSEKQHITTFQYNDDDYVC